MPDETSEERPPDSERGASTGPAEGRSGAEQAERASAGGVSPPAASEAMGEETTEEQVETEQEVAETDEAAAAELAREDADSAAAEPTEEEVAPEPLSETEQQILDRLEQELGDGVIESASIFGTLVVRVQPGAWRRAAEVSRDALECDYLSFVAGIDWQPAPREGGEGGESSAPVQPTEMTFGAAGSAGRFQVFAYVQSTSRKWGVTLKTDVDEAAPLVESWVPVYPGADWHERECWEMYGVAFGGHPSLRHIYLPSEFEGHPLRKDFPLLAREVKPWPGLVDVEPMPGDDTPAEGEGAGTETEGGDET